MERIGDDVRSTLGRFGPQGAMGDVVQAWPGAVGESIARNAWPARVARDGTLHVATSSSAWAFELTQLEPSIRERLAAAVGEGAPPRLRFTPGRLPEQGPAAGAEARPPAPEPSLDERRAGRKLAAAIEDEELRELVARAAAASLAGGRSGRAL